MTTYSATSKLNSFCELLNLPDNMMYLNQASIRESDDSLIGDRDIFPTTTHNFDGARDLQNQGLSLSLGMKLPSSAHLPSMECHFGNLDPSYELNQGIQGCSQVGSQSEESKISAFLSFGLGGNKDVRTNFGEFNKPQCSKEMQYAPQLHIESGFPYAISDSKYLKGAQQLLDEVVNVYESLKQIKSKTDLNTNNDTSVLPLTNELSNAQRLDLHNKQMKLFSLLDEVFTMSY